MIRSIGGTLIPRPTCAQPLTGHDFAPPQKLLDQLNREFGDVTLLSPMASAALAAASATRSSKADLYLLVQRDAGLSSSMLSIVDAAFLVQASTTTDIECVLEQLLPDECCNLILAASAVNLMKHFSLTSHSACLPILRHSCITATVCRHMNLGLELGFQGEEFTAGLLHDIGRLLLVTADSKSFESADDLSFDEDINLLEQERYFFGCNHCELGAWFASQWSLPKPLIDAILHHHLPHYAVDHQVLVTLVATADHMANHLQRTGGAAGYDPGSNEFLLLLAELTDPSLERQFSAVAELLLATVVNELARTGGILA